MILTTQSAELKSELKALSDMQTSLQRENKKYRAAFYLSSGIGVVVTGILIYSLLR
jgi:hypothetical protein